MQANMCTENISARSAFSPFSVSIKIFTIYLTWSNSEFNGYSVHKKFDKMKNFE